MDSKACCEGSDAKAVASSQSSSTVHDADQGGTSGSGTVFKADKAGKETVLHTFTGVGGTAHLHSMIPVVPPKSNRREPWDYDRELYKKRNQIERLFRRLKGFRRIFSRFEKLDVVFLAFIYFAFIIEALR